MYKIAILGCENSHANQFLTFLKNKIVDDVEVVGVYSEDRAAAEKLHETFGVPVADSYDAFVGKVDGIMNTARHGDNHYKYLKPYLDCGIPMYIDKPITCTEEDAKAFMAELKQRQIPVCGGSVCPLDARVQELKKVVESGEQGKVLGGYFRAPVSMVNEWGDFFFYSQHLVQMMTEVLGCYPKSVQVFRNEPVYTCLVRYPDFDIPILFVEGNYYYHAGVSFEKSFIVKDLTLEGAFEQEFLNFYRLLKGEAQHQSYEDFFAPVYILNAIDRSIKSGKEEPVHTF